MSAAPSSNFLPIAAMMFAAGIGIPVFAAFNSGLGKQLAVRSSRPRRRLQSAS